MCATITWSLQSRARSARRWASPAGGDRMEGRQWPRRLSNKSAWEEAEDGAWDPMAGCGRCWGERPGGTAFQTSTPDASESGEDAYSRMGWAGGWRMILGSVITHTFWEHVRATEGNKMTTMKFNWPGSLLHSPHPPTASQRHFPCCTRPHTQVPVRVFTPLSFNETK